jgi:cell division protein YceG involved in septum cleavage
VTKNAKYQRLVRALLVIASISVFLVVVGLSFPAVLQITIEREQAVVHEFKTFPVTVDPKNKSIVEDTEVNAILESANSPLQAAALGSGSVFEQVFTWIATSIAASPWYQGLAATNGRFVTINSGMRREQVANAFGSTLGWNAAQKKQFLTASGGSLLPLPEGSFSPGVYIVDRGTTPTMAQAFVNQRFSKEVIARYSTTTAAKVPLHDALTIASLIEREAGGADDMRIISGIIWNRLFLGMPLQIDATVQYVKANTSSANGWWPRVAPGDTKRRSAYNTYLNKGLPPGPIANPSVASVIAALNPKNTSCIFYFHDDYGNFHCSDTYAGHVTELKKIYGRGK